MKIKYRKYPLSKKLRSALKKMALPARIHPELATLVNAPPSGKKWLHEIKFDGYRIVCFVKGKKIKLKTRNNQDWTEKFPYLVKTLQHLNLKNTILDGELVALNNKGRSDFQLLQNALHHEETATLIYYCFDLLYYNSENWMSLPLIQRKKQLQQLIPTTKSAVLYSRHIVGKGDVLFRKACRLSLEGIVSKNIDSPYLQKRTLDWKKVKCSLRQEFIVVGFTTGTGKRKYFGSLLLAVYTKHKQLRYCGNVGTGFNEKSLKNIYLLLNKYKSTKPLFKLPIGMDQVTWVKPKVIVEVKFTEWTKAGSLRHPSFKGLRYDKRANEIIREKAKNAK
jgi:bifunctional non-homologous end joining protein LigD